MKAYTSKYHVDENILDLLKTGSKEFDDLINPEGDLI